MKEYKNILVGLDFSDADQTTLSYVKFLNERFRPEQIHFLNVQDKLDLSDEILKQFPQLESDVKKSFEDKIKAEVNAFNVYGADLFYDVLGGSIVESTLRYGKEHNIDLLVIGRKQEVRKSKFNPERLAREFATDTLLVPVGTEPKADRVMIMLDYSDRSKDAFEGLIEDAAESNLTIVATHLYEVPVGFEKTGKSFSEFSAIMKENAEKEYKKFIKDIDTKGVNIETVFEVSNDKEFSDVVIKVGKENKVDLVLVSARGRTKAAAFFLGSNTENLIQENAEFPVLITRDKEHSFGLFEAISNLM